MNRWLFLFVQWFKRDLAGRYRGSWLGLLWPVVQPAAQIAVFTLILHGFMQVRWPVSGEALGQGPSDAWLYALNVLAGLTVFNFFAEVLGRAPSAILSQPNLVTKVRFPLLLLPAVTVGVALVHVGIGAAALDRPFFRAALAVGHLDLQPGVRIGPLKGLDDAFQVDRLVAIKHGAGMMCLHRPCAAQ